MPKVLRIINRLNLGGPTYNAAYLSKYISDDFETLLVAGMKDESEASSEYIVDSLDLKPSYINDMYREINPLKDYPAYKELVRIIKDFKPDIVHTHAAKAGAIGRLAAHNCGVPIVLHTFHGHVFHSYFGKLKTRVFIEIERFLARRSTKIIAISNIQKQELCEQFKIAPCDKFEVVQLGFDLERFQKENSTKRKTFRKNYKVDENAIAIGIIGRLVPIKNHKLLLQAFAQVKAKTAKSIKLIIIGDGELRGELEDFCQELKLTFSDVEAQIDVLFTSWIKDIETALPGLDVVALSSFNEGTPVSLIEAQAANIPIVSTRVGGIEDIVIEGKTALLAKNNDLGDFSEKLLLLIEDEKLREEMKISGFQHVQNKFSYHTLCKNMSMLYSSLYEEHRNKEKN
ncbi:MAG: glycosyltransferase involved in cell wall biosynthesis [Chitinophagales bacterium]|jgi:glycosyltransferase involved in cell wall biosynthesis